MGQKFSGSHPFVGVVLVFNKTGNPAHDDQAANFPLTARPEESVADGVLSRIVNDLSIHIYAFDAVREARDGDSGLPYDFAEITEVYLDRKPDKVKVMNFSASELGITSCPA